METEGNVSTPKEIVLPEPQHKQTNDTLVIALSSKPHTIDESELQPEINPGMTPMLEPVDISVKLSS